ncbi:MAG: hypothetical protein A4E66_01039 [Syntrophus sp. PtaB.Bin001]|nr:MAG: hypothetical protein A4E66_01039 [Syntrophus sp. PtaB.Bin001]
MKDKSSILSGGLVLVSLGILIFLQRTTAFGFDRSWPIFLIVIGAGILLQRLRDLGGWIIGSVGIGFFLLRNGKLHFELTAYILPLSLVLVGGVIVWKNLR